ncbi:MAG: GTP-binding protein [Candidatus Thorarchaeota archaeon]
MGVKYGSAAPVYKITLLGDGAVGKTSLRDRFMRKPIPGDYLMTIGADFAAKTVEIRNKAVKFQIWDLAGQPRFESVREPYYKGTVGGLLVFDVTRPTSFESTPSWIKEIWKHNGKGRIPLVLLGNKIDLRSSVEPSIYPVHGEALAAEFSKFCVKEGFKVPYIETSAKTGENVDRAFQILGEIITDFIAKQLA